MDNCYYFDKKTNQPKPKKSLGFFICKKKALKQNMVDNNKKIT